MRGLLPGLSSLVNLETLYLDKDLADANKPDTSMLTKLVNTDGTPNAQVVTEVLDALDPTLDRNGEKTFLELIHHPRGSYLTRALVTACSSEQR